ncbi:CDP-alcohol phosphatidyltransferase family protein [Methylomonas sp. HYX-M1]|uniref:CDP-alcohol phosphatidyltransferase family protein n=1 Tax=Methylomonas sp. HYX-M1 TaxID=3139307 RepID=UPI00345BF51F
MKSVPGRWTAPNLLTGFRFAAAPGLLWLAWHGYALAFMSLLALCFLSDLLDGFVARLTGQVSEFGAMLDSWADVVNYLTIALCCWWLWPDIFAAEWLYFGFTVASCILPALTGYIKFGCFTSYHTWAVRIAAAAMGFALYVLFFGGPLWPFKMAAVLCLLAGGEEILLTLLLSEPKSNLRSLWHALKRR